MGWLHIRDLRVECQGYKDLPTEEVRQFRDIWRTNFIKTDKVMQFHHCSNCNDFKQDDAESYDWHGFSYAGVRPCDNYLEAIANLQINNNEDIIIFEENCTSPGIVVKFSEFMKTLSKNKGKSYEDIYFTPRDLSWTLVLTHEDGWIGPFFVQK